MCLIKWPFIMDSEWGCVWWPFHAEWLGELLASASPVCQALAAWLRHPHTVFCPFVCAFAVYLSIFNISPVVLVVLFTAWGPKSTSRWLFSLPGRLIPKAAGSPEENPDQYLPITGYSGRHWRLYLYRGESSSLFVCPRVNRADLNPPGRGWTGDPLCSLCPFACLWPRARLSVATAKDGHRGTRSLALCCTCASAPSGAHQP